VVLLLALLAAPIAGIHDTLFLLPLLVSRWRLPAMRMVALLLIVPVPFTTDSGSRRSSRRPSARSTTGLLCCASRRC